MNKPYPSRRSAFSLIELLAAISLISLLTVIAAPALSSLVGSTGTTRAVNDVSEVLEHARQSAMKLSTWVWVGLADTSSLNSGGAQISIVELASRDGSSDYSSSNLMPLRRGLNIAGVKLPEDSDALATVLGTTPGGFSLKWPVTSSSGRSEVDFSARVIGFSPKGEAIVANDLAPAWIKIPFVAFNNQNDRMAVLVAGSSGQVIVAK